MANHKILILHIILISFCFSHSKDVNTFSNYEQIRQTNLEINFDIDFKEKIIHGKIKTYFTALEDGEVIVLDSKALKIDSIIDSDTGEEMEYILDYQYELASHGVPLKIYKEYSKGDNISLLISCSTTENGTSVQWLTPEQTMGKKYPYMFTQGESILVRELFPTQDTPSVKTPVAVSITVEKPLFAVESGIYQNKIDNGKTITYFYEQKIPIPTYLIAMAAGAIEERVISDRIKVYAEAELVDKAAAEFEDTEYFLQVAESYLFPYQWGEYNLLVMPPSFPYGGMENPTLTFVMPSVISGDKSLIGLITHELSHSWSGNLVTMKDWANFWLNEGFDVFVDNKLTEIMKGKEMAKLDGLSYQISLKSAITSMGESKSFSSLQPYLVGRNPDDAFSTVPYIKGFLFLYYLEDLVNSRTTIDLFRKMLRQYFTKFKYQSINYIDFKNFFIEFVEGELPSEAGEILEEIDWEKWVEAPGYPPKEIDFSNIYSLIIEENVALFFDNNLPEDFVDTFKSWDEQMKYIFLGEISSSEKMLDDVQYNYITNVLNLKEGYNSIIRIYFFIIVLNKAKTLEDPIKELLIEFLGTVGRINYMLDLYPAFYKRDKDAALATLEKYRNFYHPMVVRRVELALRSLV